MLRLLQWINDHINKSSYDASLRAWAQRKQQCDEHNAKVMNDPTFPYDAFGQDKLWKVDPPPDARKHMNRSISDNIGCFIVLGFIVIGILWAVVRGAIR